MALITPPDRVLETSTTTGLGTYTLAGAMAGFRAASAVCVNADTAYYYAEDVDANGVPLGGWETGLGTWGTGNTLARTTVYTSSNANAAVSWAAGTRRISLSLVTAYLNSKLGANTNSTSLGAAIGDGANGNSNGAAFGYSSNGYTDGAAFGYASNGFNSGAAVGRSANGRDGGAALGAYTEAASNGVAIGLYAFGSSNGVAIGYGANTNYKDKAVALGYGSNAQRYREMVKSADGGSLRSWSMVDWYGDTTDATATELLLGGTAAQYCILINNSAFSFSFQIIAGVTGAGTSSSWTITGAIKRGATAATTALVGVPAVVMTGQDAGATTWAVAVAADTTNGSLKLTVTGAAATAIRWNAAATLAEMRF